MEYAKQQKQTYIMQLVEKHPEMPGELELNKERRKQSAELMLGYPTKTDEMEKENLTQEKAGWKRYYTCQNCKKSYSAIRGTLNHLEHNPKCKNVPQKETFISKCQDCGGTFHNPYGLKEHRKYICARQETDEIEEEPTNGELTRQKPQYIPLLDAEENREEEEEEDDDDDEERGEEREKEHSKTRRKQLTMGSTEEKGAIQDGYMDSHGKPRQPKQTQENKAGTLRYEQEKETWRCVKRDKKYSKQNARSAKSHANEHTKAETEQRGEYGKNDPTPRPTGPI